ncbi:hypothetical protein [Devosia sp. Leaf64]|uniref:hypothetical protein n=1 Tax=Devosia sp. Leaf64 TaxID=1736229 RepID=UPI0007125E0E|nr:hypothetical protein [Devosia sp. Leaf64]KQN75031.1 hypothetical protein ASE94_01550 [Devosia sp. Leaf64]
MDYELYGSGAPARKPEAVPPAITTMDALAAAEWTGPDHEGEWTLLWDDHTDYGNEPGPGFFICKL